MDEKDLSKVRVNQILDTIEELAAQLSVAVITLDGIRQEIGYTIPAMLNKSINVKVKFSGKLLEFYVFQLGLIILTIISFGLAAPYWIYWTLHYFFTHLEFEIKKD